MLACKVLSAGDDKPAKQGLQTHKQSQLRKERDWSTQHATSAHVDGGL